MSIPEYYKRYEITTVTSDTGRWDVRCSLCKMNLAAQAPGIHFVLEAIEKHEARHHYRDDPPEASDDENLESWRPANPDFETVWPKDSAGRIDRWEGPRIDAFAKIEGLTDDEAEAFVGADSDRPPADPMNTLPYIQVHPGGLVINTRNNWLLIKVKE